MNSIIIAVLLGAQMVDAQSVLQDLRSKNEKTRAEASFSLFEIDLRSLENGRDLLPFLKDDCDDVRSNIVANIGRLGPRATFAVSILEELALNNSEVQQIRNEAIRSLAMIGKEAIPSIRRIVARNDVILSRRVSGTLGPLVNLGEESRDAIDILLKFGMSSDRETRLNAIEALKQFARAAPLYFKKNAMSTTFTIAMPSILAISYVSQNQGDFSDRIVTELKNALTDDELELVIITLGYAKVELSGDIITVLAKSVSSSSKDVRFAAVSVICQKYLDEPLFREKIELAATDSEWEIASRAIEGLCLRGHYSERFLHLTLKNVTSSDVDPDVRRFSILALGNMGTHAVPALRALRVVQNDPEYSECAELARRLIKKAIRSKK